MPLSITAAWATLIIATALRAEGAVLRVPTPVITPGPSITAREGFVKRDDPDAIFLAQVLWTALPESLRIIAATNLPAVSSILWAEFLDDRRPGWFNQLPVDIQNYLIRNFGPSTAWPTAQTSEPTSKLSITVPTVSILTATSAVPSSVESTPPPTYNPAGGLSRNQKIGIGLGVPLAILGAAAILLVCCFLLRRRKKRSINGSQPPSSPGFIPRFAFQEKDEHHTPLNRESSIRQLSQDTTYSNAFNWDDDVIEPMDNTHMSSANKVNNQTSPIRAPVAAPSLYHTHSSNRARGKRTSYWSLHSVAEVHEPEESPVLPRDSFRPSAPRRLSSGLIPGSAQTKRKPVPSMTFSASPRSSTNTTTERGNLAAAAAAATLLRPSIPSNNNSESTQSSTSAPSSVSPVPFHSSSTTIPTSPVSPMSPTSPVPQNPFHSPAPTNPFISDPALHNEFLNDYYVEDYGPEYTNVFPYDDLENSLYGGYPDLSRYPQYDQMARTEVPRKNASRTEWPLRNTGRGDQHRRNKNPLWDRVYDG